MSQTDPALSRSPLRRPAAIAFVGAAILGASLWLSFHQANDAVTAPHDTAPKAAVPTSHSAVTPSGQASAQPPSAVGSDKPSFDIVRVNPQGDAVIAGRAAPNADVAVVDNGQEIGRTKADAHGQFVIVPETKLATGDQQLTLTARSPDGTLAKSDAPVLLLVPAVPGTPPTEAAARRVATTPAGATPGTIPPGMTTSTAASSAPPAPIAVLIPLNAPPRVLQAPGRASEHAGAPARLGLDAVDYDEHGQIRFSGTAAAGATVRVYIDNHAVGDAQANADRNWSLTPRAAIAAGQHHLRVDQIGPAGNVIARVELPIERAKPSQIVSASTAAVTSLASGQVVVQPGQSLWRISRDAYGLGVQYVTIYAANRDQIRDPHWIYPGQVFAVPAKPATAATGGATPVSSSTSK